MNTTAPFSLLPCVIIGFLMVACVPASRAADYGAKASFKKDAPIAFPDFVLTYLGERHVATARYPRGFTYYDFRVSNVTGTQTVSWTAGTGDIGPAVFQLGTKQFWLELSRSDKLGPLKAGEVVVSHAP